MFCLCEFSFRSSVFFLHIVQLKDSETAFEVKHSPGSSMLLNALSCALKFELHFVMLLQHPFPLTFEGRNSQSVVVVYAFCDWLLFFLTYLPSSSCSATVSFVI
jgi:hypothetical protein